MYHWWPSPPDGTDMNVLLVVHEHIKHILTMFLYLYAYKHQLHICVHSPDWMVVWNTLNVFISHGEWFCQMHICVHNTQKVKAKSVKDNRFKRGDTTMGLNLPKRVEVSDTHFTCWKTLYTTYSNSISEEIILGTWNSTHKFHMYSDQNCLIYNFVL